MTYYDVVSLQLLDNLTVQRDEVRESHRAILEKHHQKFHHTCAPPPTCLLEDMLQHALSLRISQGP